MVECVDDEKKDEIISEEEKGKSLGMEMTYLTGIDKTANDNYR